MRKVSKILFEVYFRIAGKRWRLREAETGAGEYITAGLIRLPATFLIWRTDRGRM